MPLVAMFPACADQKCLSSWKGHLLEATIFRDEAPEGRRVRSGACVADKGPASGNKNVLNDVVSG